MKKVYLTFDIETIISRISKNDDYLIGVYLSTMRLAEEIRKRDLKATFFLSLSPKQKIISFEEYREMLNWLIYSLKSYQDNIRIQAHIHAYNLPMDFDCKFDAFNKYSNYEQVELLKFSKKYFEDLGIEVDSFRPGGFCLNENYYKNLKEAGFKNSSVLNKLEEPSINLKTGNLKQSKVFTTDEGIAEYPVTSVKIKSIKGKDEILNLSPDFFTLKSVEAYLSKLNYININFHSFSIYQNRLIRENHKNLWIENIKFVCFENVVRKLLKKTVLKIYNSNTVFSKELINWLNFFKEKKYETYFIGE